MPVIFANPFGFFALLGLPVILLIHFLQRQSQTLPCSTLFLLDAIDRRSLRGRKVDRLRNSLPLWLQLLAVILLTWLLVDPRWESEAATQRVVIVLDTSASMAAFSEQAIAGIEKEIPPLTAAVGSTAYTVLESHPEGQRLYRGENFPSLLSSLAGWQPGGSAHSPEAALRVGRSLAGPEGVLIFLTDHIDTSLPYGATLLAVGEPLDNVGFAGLSIDDSEPDAGITWQATVRNYSDASQTREWFLAAGSERTSPRSITLEPRATRILSGKFPDGSDRITLVLEPDRFLRDDRLYLVIPQRKPVTVAFRVDAEALDLIRNIHGSLSNAPLFVPPEENPGPADPDLVFATYNPLSPSPLTGTSIVLINQKNAPRRFFSGPIVATRHELMENLNWQGLIAKSTPSIPLSEGDIPLLWQGDRALILLRERETQQQLLFNFDVWQSNASRLPAFIILIHRFVDSVRSGKIAPQTLNTELRQPLPLALITSPEAPPVIVQSSGREQRLPPGRATLLRAPRDPGFYSIRQGQTQLLTASANFADTREADFSATGFRSDLRGVPGKVLEQQTVTDPFWKIGALAFLLLSIFCWHLLKRADTESPATETA